ncbi:MAG: hypothetical protein MUF38_02990 [Anaerolineae bacterium]|nr:hypothetical protein [Anaerolineae bacterium]
MLPLLAVVALAAFARANPTRAAAFDCDFVTDVSLAECNVLVDIYNTMDGPSWVDNTGWLSDDDTTVCDWYGVSCNLGVVEALFLSSNGLSGSIPSSIDDLVGLTYLSLSGVEGVLPVEIATMTALTNLSVEGDFNTTLFTGPLPNLSALVNLVNLDIRYSTIGGSIPAWINETNFPNLTSISLSNNGFSGSVPSGLTSMVGLERVDITTNQLTGGLPDFSASCATLNTLWLGFNSFNVGGSIPAWLNDTDCSNLAGLNLAHSGLTGPFPDLSGFSGLVSLSLQDNHFDLGPVPAWVTSKTDWQFISLQNTLRDGALPEFAGVMNDLYSLSLDNNRFTGSIPASYNRTNFPQLISLGLFSNLLETIHSNFATFDDGDFFVTVYLNKLIPSSLDPAVQTLLNNVNQFWDIWQIVPPTGLSLTPIAGGTTVDVTFNRIEIPSFFDMVYRVQASETPGGPYTTVASGSSSGGTTAPLTVTVSGLAPETTYYFVVRSSLTTGYGDPGPINLYERLSAPSAEASTTTLEAFSPTNCADTATNGIPQAECDALVTVYNTRNGVNWTNQTNWLTGSPCTWYGITCLGGRIRLVNLSNNNLTGNVPNLSALSEMYYFNVAGNALTGGFPSWLANHSAMEYINFSDNNLSGSIPNLGALVNLTDLWLQGNSFTGNFPGGLTNKTMLNRIILDNNQFSGTIPNLTGVSSLLILQASNNDFSGLLPALPSESFVFLGLAANRITGSVPASYGSLMNLSGLALDGNQLEGEIPASIGDLPDLGEGEVLSYVGFSYNKLTATDADVLALLAVEDPDFDQTQTLPVTGLATGAVGDNTVTLSWTPILYTANNGYYEIGVRAGTTGPFTYDFFDRTANKTNGGFTIPGLVPASEYCFTVRAVTLPHNPGMFNGNKSTLTSPETTPVCATTTGVNPSSPASAPQLLEPSDGLVIYTTQSPVFTWQLNPAAENVTTYRLVVRTSNGREIFNTNFNAATVCTDVCRFDFAAQNPPIVLPLDHYMWQVHAANFNGSNQSSYQMFMISRPTATILTSPAFDARITGSKSPVFVWQDNAAIESVTRYRMTVRNTATGTVVLRRNLTPANVCASGVCMFNFAAQVPIIELANGAYDWQLRTTNALGSINTIRVPFTITNPSRPMLTSPVGGAVINDPTPDLTFSLAAGEGVTQFRLLLRRTSDGVAVVNAVYDVATYCTGTDCTFPVAGALTNGGYTWWVRAINANGTRKSVNAAFSVGFPDRATGLSPDADAVITTNQPVLSWNEVANATEYRVFITHIPTGQRVVLGWVSAGAPGFTCAAGVCSLDMAAFTGSPTLRKNNHRWFVRARNTALAPTSTSKSLNARFSISLATRSTDGDESLLPLPPSDFRAP